MSRFLGLEELLKKKVQRALRSSPIVIFRFSVHSVLSTNRVSTRVEESSSAEMEFQQYQKLELIGEGRTGVVYRGRDLTTGKMVAIKKIRSQHSPQVVGVQPFVLREISILQDLRHENIVCLQDVIQQDKKVYLIFEYLDEDLKRYMKTCPLYLSQWEIQSFIYQILLGVNHCHMTNIMHRDLKPDNILIDKMTMNLKVADFSLSRHFQGDQKTLHVFTNEVVSLWYRAPELLLGANHYSSSIDMWAVGCILAEMGLREPLFKEASEIKQLIRIFHVLGTPDETTWPGVTGLQNYKPFASVWPPRMLSIEIPGLEAQAINLLEKLLTLDPRRRITAQAALDHEYFEDLRDNLKTRSIDDAGTSRQATVRPSTVF